MFSLIYYTNSIVNYYNNNIQYIYYYTLPKYLLEYETTDTNDKIIIDYNTTMHTKITTANYSQKICVLIPTKKIITEIADSYNNIITETQLTKDFDRMRIFYNFIMCSTLPDFLSLITKYKHHPHTITNTIYNLFLILCTQSTFFYPFNILHHLYNTQLLHIIQSDDFPLINIIDNNKSLKIIIKKKFIYINPITSQTITTFATFTTINISKPISTITW